MTDTEEHEWPPLVEESRDLLVGKLAIARLHQMCVFPDSFALMSTARGIFRVAATNSQLMKASILMYGVTDLRSLARQGKISGDKILQTPFTAQDVVDVAKENKEIWKEQVGEQNYKMYGSALHQLQQENEVGGYMAGKIVVVDDEHSESELVFGISVSQVKERIIVAFRGSSTPRDFLVDADGSFTDLDNPLNPESTEKMGIHHGFYTYLNARPKSASKHASGDESRNDDDTPTNKFEEIMSKLQPLFVEYPDYHLYVTGHSLGASLAILFSVQAAASTRYNIPKPVTCINFASPKVGDRYFRDCFQSLEIENKLRCIRFVNSGDIIPTLPDRQNYALCRWLKCRSSVYRHCGPKIILSPDGSFKVAYEKDDSETIWTFLRDVRYTCGHGIGFVMMIPTLLYYNKFFLTNHGCGTYLDRFNSEFSKSNLYLNDVYKQEVAKLKKK